MQRSLCHRFVTTTFAAVVVAASADEANATCGIDPALLEAPTFHKESWTGSGVRVQKVDWRNEDEPIVGYWNVVLTSKGSSGIPDGAIIDKGLSQWHPDGTEFLNSSAQKPQTQNFCTGVWLKVGPSSYTLNHFAYNYDAAQNLVGLTRIREDVTVRDNGQKYVGTFSIDGYDINRNHLVRIVGTILGKRIDVTTTAQEIQ